MKISKNAMGNIVAEAAELMNIFLVDCQEVRATINAIIDYCQSGKLPSTSARIKPAFWEFLKAKIDKIAERAELARLRREQKRAAQPSKHPENSEPSKPSKPSELLEPSDKSKPIILENPRNITNILDCSHTSRRGGATYGHSSS